MTEQKMRSYEMTEIVARGFDVVMDEVIDASMDECDGVFLSVDIDVVDPGSAPGTGTPEPGGLTARQLLDAVRDIAYRVPLLGIDVVEVSPPYDHADITALLGKGYPQRAGPSKNPHGGTLVQQGALIGPAGNRAFGGQHRHTAAIGNLAGRHGTGFYHAEYRHGSKLLSQGTKRGRGRGITRHHQDFNAPRNQRARGLLRIALDRRCRLGAIG